MKEIAVRSNVQPAAEAGARKFRKSQSLRLDKQTIRTLTGAELKLIGGGCPDGSNCTGRSDLPPTKTR